MPEGVGYGPQNTSSVGLNLNVIGDHAYAYSGAVDVNSGVTVLNFTTGSFYLVGHFEFSGNWSDAGNNYVLVDVKFDGEIMLRIAERRDLGAGSDQPFNIVIPPYTKVEVVYAGVGASTDFTSNITGRIYK